MRPSTNVLLTSCATLGARDDCEDEEITRIRRELYAARYLVPALLERASSRLDRLALTQRRVRHLQRAIATSASLVHHRADWETWEHLQDASQRYDRAMGRLGCRLADELRWIVSGDARAQLGRVTQ